MSRVLAAALAVSGTLVAAADFTPNHAAVPADGRILLSDPGLRDWGPELVRYQLDTARFVAGKLALVGSDGQAVPFQIEGQTLVFVARLSRGGSSSYTLKPSATDRSAENSTLAVKETADGIELANEFLSVRLPGANEKDLGAPVEANRIEPPLRQWRQAGQDWVGGAHFVTARKIASRSFKMLRNGPACAEFEARYSFVPLSPDPSPQRGEGRHGGEYVCRVRLSPGVPLIYVTEEFDMGETTNGEDQLVLEFHKGWQPQNIAWVPWSNEQQMPELARTGYAPYVEGKRGGGLAEAKVGGVGEAPQPFAPEKNLVLCEAIVPGFRWGALKGGVQVYDGPTLQPPTARNFGLVPLHVGSWRRTMALFAWHKQDTGLLVSLPLSVRPMRWSLECADDLSPFSTHEHDEGLSATYGRREWAFYVGSALETAQPQFGLIGLDRFKDWIVDWPEGNAAKNAYPGSMFRPEHVARLKKALSQNPWAADLRARYLISGDQADAVKNAQTVIAKLKHPYGENDFFFSGMCNYRKAQLLIFANEAEDALACPQLPADLRRELRQGLALYAYVTADPDWNPRGSGIHLGNNNMPINRGCAQAYFAGLLPDHPCFNYWMKCLENFVRSKLTTQFSPFGESLECPSYQIYAPHGGLNVAINVLRNRGFADFTGQGALKQNLTYLANLTMPDPRLGGTRVVPGMGNGGNLQLTVWGMSVATFLDQDPAFAGWCKAMYQAAGTKYESISTGVTFVGHPMYYLPDVPATPLKFETTFMPAYGVAFRAHGGTPHETAMLLRAGCNWGHWDTDALNVILYGKGAPLSPGTGYQYYGGIMTKNHAIYHNRVKVGTHDQQEVFGRVDDAVSDYGFGTAADYAVADRFYPPEVFADGKGEMHWRRHVLFLKSDKPEGPSYFVLRDTFPGGEARNKWWTWLNLGMPDKIAVDGKAFPNGIEPEKEVSEAEMPVLRGQTLEMATDFGASSWFWFHETHKARIRCVGKYPGAGGPEVKSVLEVLAGAGQDYFYVIFPRKTGEATPACSQLSPGVLKITTTEATDYAFVSDAPLKFAGEDVLFEGKAGAVRVFADRVALCLLSGSGRIGYRGMIFEGNRPFEKIVALKDLKPGTNKAGGEEKKTLSVKLSDEVTVQGEGPFEAKLDGQTIFIHTEGRRRILYVTKPPWIIRPALFLDGEESMASWTDYPASGWGKFKNTWLMALEVPDGSHELMVKTWVFPLGWGRTFEPTIPGVLRKSAP